VTNIFRKPIQFFTLPHSLLRKGLVSRMSLSACRICICLGALAETYSAVRIQISIQELAVLTGLHRESVIKGGKELERLGVVARSNEADVIVYQFLNPDSGEPIPAPEGHSGYYRYRVSKKTTTTTLEKFTGRPEKPTRGVEKTRQGLSEKPTTPIAPDRIVSAFGVGRSSQKKTQIREVLRKRVEVTQKAEAPTEVLGAPDTGQKKSKEESQQQYLTSKFDLKKLSPARLREIDKGTPWRIASAQEEFQWKGARYRWTDQ